MPSAHRPFVLRHTRLRPVPGIPGLRLHLADEILPLWGDVQRETRDPDAALPYWAFAWAGGLAIARYLTDHPETVADRRVFDLGSGSGLCALVALAEGSSGAAASEIDPYGVAAIDLNAKANGRRITIVARDVLDEHPPDADVVLAGDCWYETGFADRVLPWLRRAQAAGLDVLLGDPGRRYLPSPELVELATYDVRTTTELEDQDQKRAAVYALR